MDTPVALIVFNRPDTTAEVMRTVRQARPSRLFIIADAPRPDHPEDIARCAAVRTVVEQIDWECEVLRKYADTNLGCAHGVSSGISWVFEHVDRAIILEDDCVPDQSFFPFCEELLTRYQNDERIMMVSGNNFLAGQHEVPHSYFLQMYSGMWGWATWRRAWRHHDLAIRHWPLLRETSWLADVLPDPRGVAYWQSVFDQAHAAGGDFHTWDAQWYFAMWSQHGLAVTPRVNLVKNIGFRPDATHTKGHARLANLTAGVLTWPLSHPKSMVRDREADRVSMANGMSLPMTQPSLYRRLRRRLAHSIPAPIRSQLLALRSRMVHVRRPYHMGMVSPLMLDEQIANVIPLLLS